MAGMPLSETLDETCGLQALSVHLPHRPQIKVRYWWSSVSLAHGKTTMHRHQCDITCQMGHFNGVSLLCDLMGSGAHLWRHAHRPGPCAAAPCAAWLCPPLRALAVPLQASAYMIQTRRCVRGCHIEPQQVLCRLTVYTSFGASARWSGSCAQISTCWSMVSTMEGSGVTSLALHLLQWQWWSQVHTNMDMNSAAST